MKKIKTAIVYDKWLSQLGGGEVVACTTAKILKDLNYKVLFITGKEVSINEIKKKLNLDLTGVNFETVWNDEYKLKQLSKNKDLFINLTYLDYSEGRAKKNIYYTHFPTKAYNSLKGMVVNTILLPALVRGFIPVESIDAKVQRQYNQVVYSLAHPARFAYYYLVRRQVYRLQFTIFLPKFSKSLLKKLFWKIEGADVKKINIEVKHRENFVKVIASVSPTRTTVYLDVGKKKSTFSNSTDAIFLLFKPQLFYFFNPSGFLDWAQQRLNRRFRAGLFLNVLKRMHSYDETIANSQFTGKWIEKYWKRDVTIIYPPVKLVLDEKKIIDRTKRKNWIVSTGRFFTKGHNKKQKIMIKAFKKFYDSGFRKWQLHLIGGVGSDIQSQKFVELLRKQASGYPIVFHLNTTRQQIEAVLLASTLYWHATGYGENERKNPIFFEHFGIAPVEAISAGCIPILYNGGGLVETIRTLELDENKHLFRTIDELVEKTILFTKTKEKKSIDWGKVYKLLDENYSQKVFEKKFIELIQKQ